MVLRRSAPARRTERTAGVARCAYCTRELERRWLVACTAIHRSMHRILHGELMPGGIAPLPACPGVPILNVLVHVWRDCMRPVLLCVPVPPWHGGGADPLEKPHIAFDPRVREAPRQLWGPEADPSWCKEPVLSYPPFKSTRPRK